MTNMYLLSKYFFCTVKGEIKRDRGKKYKMRKMKTDRGGERERGGKKTADVKWQTKREF